MVLRVGGAAGTVAKTISAYDMTVSDGIYGKSHRYVTPSCRAWPTSSRGIGSRWTSWMCRGHSSSVRMSAAITLDLVLEKLGRVVMFGPDGHPVEPSRGLYKKPVFVLRQSFRPLRPVDLDMLAAATEQLQEAPDRGLAVSLAEIPIARVNALDDVRGDLLGRLDTLAAAGLPTLVTDVGELFRVADHLRRYATPRVVFVAGTQTFTALFREKPFENLPGGVFEVLGRLFTRGVTLALYPDRDPRTGEPLQASAAEVPSEYRHLLRHLLDNGLIHELRALPARPG